MTIAFLVEGLLGESWRGHVRVAYRLDLFNLFEFWSANDLGDKIEDKDLVID